MLTILISIAALWILWKLFKFSLWLLGILIVIALGVFCIKALLIPGLIIILGLLGWGIFNQN